jgi:hypothetical protein
VRPRPAGRRELQGSIVISAAARVFPQCHPKTNTEEAAKTNLKVAYTGSTAGVAYTAPKKGRKNRGQAGARVAPNNGETATRYCFDAAHAK